MDGPVNGRDGSGYLHTICGTPGYMAPEILKRLPYRGESVDVFSCGVILFAAYTGNCPFSQATENDAYYKAIIKHKYDAFWKAH